MENLKINLCGITDKEKQNAVWCLNELGFSTGFKSIDFYSYLYGCVGSQAPYDKTIQFGNSSKTFSRNTGKEITIPELRDLVVLKRNDRKDANVYEENCLYDLYLTESKELYFYHCSKNKWILSNLNGDDFYYELLKPIETVGIREDFLVGVGAAIASLQGQSDFPLNNYELNHRVAKAFNAVRGTDLNEDDVNYLRELISLTVSHYGERK